MFPMFSNFVPGQWGVPFTGHYPTDLGLVIDRPASALPQAATQILFTVSGGPVLLVSIIGTVTATVGAVANNTKLTHGSTDICAVLNITGSAVGTRFSITGTFANAMVSTASGVPVAIQATRVVLPAGNLILNCAGSDGGGGRVQWTVVYVPMSSSSIMYPVIA